MVGKTKRGKDKAQKALNITHGRIFGRYWGSILVTFLLIIVSSGLWLFQPFLLGVAIDGMTKGQWIGVASLAGLQALALFVGAARRLYDVRVYTRIYRDIGAETLAASHAANVEITRVAARASMLREVVTFFEFRVPATLRSFLDLVGSLGFLAFLSMEVFVACLSGAVVIAALAAAFSGRLLRVNAALNDQLEREVDIYAGRSAEEARLHLKALTGHQVRRADLQVAMFSVNSVALMGVLFYSLYHVVSVQGAAIGAVFAVFTYVVRFLGAVDALPTAYVELLRTIEITRRINDIVIAEPEDEESRASLSFRSDRLTQALALLAAENGRPQRFSLFGRPPWNG
ncbi:MAG: ABC transporter six-transmembrane domain-containing protein [Parvularculaceae bacterium]